MYPISDTKQKSVSRWSRPQTPEQVAYYSTHAPKRRIYGLVQSVVQIIWAAISFVACQNLFDWFFVHAPVLQPLSPYMAAATLLALHVLLRTTYQTYWYDKLDNRTETDSSPVLPVLIMAALVLLDYQGAKIFISGQIEKQKYADTGVIDDQYRSAAAKLDADYERRRQDIDRIFDQKAATAALPFEQKIQSLRRTRAKSASEAKYIRGQISDLERKAERAKAPYLTTKADSLSVAMSAHQSRLTKAEQRRDKALGKAETTNEREDQRYSSALTDADSFAWVVSLFFMVLFALLGYSIVRIHVKSGILPERQYTDLDAHGSALDKIGIAVNDAAKRQLHRFAVGLHNALATHARELTDFDGNVIVRDPAANDTPALPANTPRPLRSAPLADRQPRTFAVSLPATINAPAYQGDLAGTGEQNDQLAPKNTLLTGTQSDPFPPENAVSTGTQVYTVVTAGAVVGGEAFLRDATTRIRREMSNLINANGRKETVAGRLVGLLENVTETLGNPEFTAPATAVQKFLQYLQIVAEPTMRTHRVDYDFQGLWNAASGVKSA